MFVELQMNLSKTDYHPTKIQIIMQISREQFLKLTDREFEITQLIWRHMDFAGRHNIERFVRISTV
jgi:hypothetical protein